MRCGVLLGLTAMIGCAKVERDWGPLQNSGGNGGSREAQGGASSGNAGSISDTAGAGGTAPGSGGSRNHEQGGVSPDEGGKPSVAGAFVGGGAGSGGVAPGEAGGEGALEGGTAGRANPASGGVPDASGGAQGGSTELGGAASGGDRGAGGTSPGGSSGSGGSSAGGNGEAGAGGVIPECAIGRYASTGTPLFAPVSTVDQGNDFSPSCGSGTAPDVAVLWTAPATGWYAFDTAGSAFDTVLGIYQPSCTGTELACNNNVASGPTSEILRGFDRGQSALVVIDGNSGARGEAVLNVQAITCPDQDLTGQPLPADLTTVGGSNTHTGACGGDGQLERMYRWTAPADGLYRFSVTSDAIRPALYVERGPRCGGELLGCHAAYTGMPASVTRWLPAGQTVTLIVDSTGGSGLFTLDVEAVSDSCSGLSRPESDNDYVLDTTAGDLLTSSCGPLAERWGLDLNEHLYSLSPACCGGIHVRSDSALTGYLLLGEHCDGPEVACKTSTCSDGECTLSLSTSDQSYVLVIETNGASPVTYSFGFTCAMCG
jgi:hypothetical protein